MVSLSIAIFLLLLGEIFPSFTPKSGKHIDILHCIERRNRVYSSATASSRIDKERNVARARRMADEQTHEAAERPKPIDFFISYTGVDRAWAVWIAWQLEAAGYTTVIQAWDFLAGNSFVQEMDQATLQAERTIAVLSSDYFQSRFTPSEWQEAFRRDPTGAAGLLLPIRVRECEAAGLLGARGYLDLVGLDEQAAREKLLTKVRRTRAKPDVPPTFPGSGRPASLPASVPPIFPSLVSSTFCNTPLDIFISCAQNDHELCAELVKHLTSLKRQRIVREWHIGYIIPNTLQEPKILKHLAKAQVILLLISEYFLNSEFCSSSEMNYALARHKAAQACTLPILFRPPASIPRNPFTDLPMLPENKIAVTSWSNKDQAYVAIVEGIRRV